MLFRVACEKYLCVLKIELHASVLAGDSAAAVTAIAAVCTLLHQAIKVCFLVFQ